MIEMLLIQGFLMDVAPNLKLLKFGIGFLIIELFRVDNWDYLNLEFLNLGSSY